MENLVFLQVRHYTMKHKKQHDIDDIARVRWQCTAHSAFALVSDTVQEDPMRLEMCCLSKDSF